MKLDKIILVPEARIIFMKEDVEKLSAAAKGHHDAVCRSQNDGVLRNLRNQLTHSNTAEICCDIHQVNILAKIAESPLCPMDIHNKLVSILKQMMSAGPRIAEREV